MTDRLTYWDYIKLDVIHDLQSNVQTDNYDEVMFIAVHQHFELWFAQSIRDLTEVIRRLAPPHPDLAGGVALLVRVNRAFACAVQGFEVMKTLSRESFLSFRDALRGTSGLQSAQLTVIELLVGRRADEMYQASIAGPGMDAFLEKYCGENGLLTRVAAERAQEGTLRDAYDRLAADPNVAPALLDAFKRELIQLDDHLAGWRPRHYEMAATVLGPDFTGSAGTVGNHLSCHDNLTTGMRKTHRYFADLVAPSQP
jgi:tryptophan 2,3-dioxygenase